MFATTAGAAELELRLPPSDAWVERQDPLPLPTATSTSRYFEHKGDAEIVLRVVVDASLRLDYSLPVLKEMSTRLVASQAKPGGTPLKVSEPRLFTAEGVSIGSFQVIDPVHTSTLFYLPAEGGDRVIGVIAPTGRALDLHEIVAVVEGAKNLRKPDTFASGPVIMGAIGAVSLVGIGVLLFFMRRK